MKMIITEHKRSVYVPKTLSIILESEEDFGAFAYLMSLGKSCNVNDREAAYKMSNEIFFNLMKGG